MSSWPRAAFRWFNTASTTRASTTREGHDPNTNVVPLFVKDVTSGEGHNLNHNTNDDNANMDRILAHLHPRAAWTPKVLSAASLLFKMKLRNTLSMKPRTDWDALLCEHDLFPTASGYPDHHYEYLVSLAELAYRLGVKDIGPF